MKQQSLFDFAFSEQDLQLLLDQLTDRPRRIEDLAETASLTLTRAAELLALAALQGRAREVSCWNFVVGKPQNGQVIG